jgi:hypothetical protein
MGQMEIALSAVASGILQVDDEGRIWKVKDRSRKGIRDIAPRRIEQTSTAGYLIVGMWLNGSPFLVSAHRLVWTVKNGPIPDRMDINHIDGNKKNNLPSNLEVVTRSENLKHASRTGLRSYRNVAREIAPKVMQMRAAKMSYASIAEALSVSTGTVFRAIASAGL